ncbi:ATP-binding protein [Aliiroseovarius crassostreae]|uniref:ATP-binding protein n=1 Tax=Aliiroseovarius crassostreae TaxID=154981 RepID=UPI00220160C2|nr:ATP-binding protein [Aliiroseovarius crassostreae]UWQ04583.1 ATP-binding protein [Aliiroseovarius crassostreae]
MAAWKMQFESLSFMGHARDLNPGTTTATHSGLNLVFPGDALAVRDALQSIRDQLEPLGIRDDIQGTLEIVLAEALNNVVEHAYRDLSGVIEVSLHRQGSDLWISILDDGHPMPNGELPEGEPYDLEQMDSNLPEGGFGWFLIRELTQNLSYDRSGSQNKMTCSIPLENSLS